MKKRYFSLFVKSCQKNVTQTPPKRTLSPGKVEKIRFLKIEKIENVFTKKNFLLKNHQTSKNHWKNCYNPVFGKKFFAFLEVEKIEFLCNFKT